VLLLPAIHAEASMGWSRPGTFMSQWAKGLGASTLV